MKALKHLPIAAATAAFLVVPATALAGGDRDHDKLPDKWEKHFHLSTHEKSGKGDPDRDHVSNRREFKFGLNPTKRDTDGDGVPDNKDQAGVVRSFHNDFLKIDMVNGGSLKGTVDDQTEISCGDGTDGASAARLAQDDGTGGDDNSEPGDGNGDPGDDQGDPGDDNGDPDPGDQGQDDNGDTGDTGSDDYTADDGTSACSYDDLVPGAKVHEAELDMRSDGAFFAAIELAE